MKKEGRRKEDMSCNGVAINEERRTKNIREG